MTQQPVSSYRMIGSSCFLEIPTHDVNKDFRIVFSKFSNFTIFQFDSSTTRQKNKEEQTGTLRFHFFFSESYCTTDASENDPVFRTPDVLSSQIRPAHCPAPSLYEQNRWATANWAVVMAGATGALVSWEEVSEELITR
jgi:hypothetical protein